MKKGWMNAHMIKTDEKIRIQEVNVVNAVDLYKDKMYQIVKSELLTYIYIHIYI